MMNRHFLALGSASAQVTDQGVSGILTQLATPEADGRGEGELLAWICQPL
jgi:hypothetical protein